MTIRSSCRSMRFLAWSALCCAGLASSVAWGAEAGSLYQQSLTAFLARQFASPDLSYLMIDADTGAVLAVRWEWPEEPAPLGSLVKPFTALAYAESHDFRYPSSECRGA